MRAVTLLGFVAFFLCSCATDRLDPRTALCAVDSYQTPDEVWFNGTATNTVTGLIAVARAPDRIDVWRNCGRSGKKELTTALGAPSYLRFSRTGKFLIASRAVTLIEIFDVEESRSIALLKDCYGAGVISPDERFAVVTCLDGVRIFDLKERRLLPDRTFDPGDSVQSMTANESFDWLSFGTGRGEVVLAALDRKADDPALRFVRKLGRPEENWTSGVAFTSRAGELVSVSRGGRVDLWDTISGRAKQTWQTPLRWVGSVTFYENGQHVAIFGTLTPGGLVQSAAAFVDVQTGTTRMVQTSSNLLNGSYVPRLHALIVMGAWARPQTVSTNPESR